MISAIQLMIETTSYVPSLQELFVTFKMCMRRQCPWSDVNRNMVAVASLIDSGLISSWFITSRLWLAFL